MGLLERGTFSKPEKKDYHSVAETIKDYFMYKETKKTPAEDWRHVTVMFLFSFILIISPLLVLMWLREPLNLDFFANNDILSQFHSGVVFVTTTAVMSRLLVRTSFRVGIRGSLYASLRMSSRAIFRATLGIRTKDIAKNIMGDFVLPSLKIGGFHEAIRDNEFLKQIILLLISWVILSISFFWVYITKHGHATIEIVLLSGFPLIIIYFSEYTAAHLKRLKYKFFITIDGTFVQLLFVLGQSFVPLVHDIEVDASIKDRALISFVGWIILAFVGLFTYFIFLETQISIFDFLASFCFLYLLVISIPIKPLEGADFWEYNRVVSLILLLLGLVLAILLINSKIALLI